MANYQAPEGYLYDKGSGLYYSQVVAVDSAGLRSQVVTWFDAETGEYRQEVYPIVETRLRGSRAGTGRAAGPGKNRASFDKRLIVIPAAAGIGILVLLVVILVTGFWKPGWLRHKSGEESIDAEDEGAMSKEYGEEPPEPVQEELPEAEESAPAPEEEVPEEPEDAGYSEEESTQIASDLLSYQEFLRFDLGESQTDSYGVEIFDYEFSTNFDEEGNPINVNIHYLPFNLEKDDFDMGASRTIDYEVQTLNKWMEGKNTACVSFKANGYTILMKLDYDQEILYSTIESVDNDADPEDPLRLMNRTVPDFGTKEDLENTRDWLHEKGIMGY